MAESDEHEFDEGLCRVEEDQSVEPPPALWSGIRMAVLERQLTAVAGESRLASNI